MTEPAQYITGFTVQEQIDNLIDYVDKRAAQVAEQWLSGEHDDSVQFAQKIFAGNYDDDDTTLGTRYGSISYNRIGEGRGLLSGSVYVDNVTAQSDWNILDLEKLCSEMGITIDTSLYRDSGTWTQQDAVTGGFNTLGGYGTYCRLYYGKLRLGRVYTTAGDTGDWESYALTGHLFTFNDVMVTEVSQ